MLDTADKELLADIEAEFTVLEVRRSDLPQLEQTRRFLPRMNGDQDTW